jgi:hypothetical protein
MSFIKTAPILSVRRKPVKRIIIYNIFVFAVFLMLYSCAGVPLVNYQPVSADEEEIIEILKRHERSWNKNDLQGFMATFDDSALIQLGCDGPLVPAKKNADSIKRIMAEYPRVKLLNPILDISGDEAVVKVKSIELGDESHIFMLEMLKENDHWLITKETCI